MEENENQKIEEEINDLEKCIKIEKKKLRKGKEVRNLRIFKHTCILLLPYLITASITVGGMHLLGLGLPFVKDKEIKNRKYTLECEKDEPKVIKSDYYQYTVLSETPENRVIITEPWQSSEERKGYYQRNINTYNLPEVTLETLYAVLDEDVSFFEEYSKTSITEYTNQEDVNSHYEFDVYLEFTDFSQEIEVPESSLVNNIMTGEDITIALLAGLFVSYLIRFPYLKKLTTSLGEYQHIEQKSNLEILRLEEKKKALILTRKEGS